MAQTINKALYMRLAKSTIHMRYKISSRPPQATPIAQEDIINHSHLRAINHRVTKINCLQGEYLYSWHVNKSWI